MTSSQLGALLSSFFWTYALGATVRNRGMADRPVPRRMGAGRWGTLPGQPRRQRRGLFPASSGFFVMRLILGAGESVAYPCYSKILAGDFPQHHRGLANALIDAGSKIGPALGHIRRRYADCAGRLALVFYRAGSRKPRVADSMVDVHAAGSCGRGHRLSIAVPGLKELLSKRSAWGAFFAHFCGNYYWFFLLTWLPMYLVRETEVFDGRHGDHWLRRVSSDRRGHRCGWLVLGS